MLVTGESAWAKVLLSESARTAIVVSGAAACMTVAAICEPTG